MGEDVHFFENVRSDASLSLVYPFVVPCDKLFRVVLRWFLRVIFGAIFSPFDDVTSVLTTALIFYDAVYRAF